MRKIVFLVISIIALAGKNLAREQDNATPHEIVSGIITSESESLEDWIPIPGGGSRINCEILRCKIYCEFGLKKNKDGCNVCECKDPLDEGSGEPEACPEPKCHNGPCLYGSLKDHDGCETCECLRPRTPKLACGLLDCSWYEGPCMFGSFKDRHGCDTCNCKEKTDEPAIEEPLLPPPPPSLCQQSYCDITCKYGLKTDDNGCNVCECQGEQLACGLKFQILKRLMNGMVVIGADYPKCDVDGSYLPKQCSGSRCYCVDEDGARISPPKILSKIVSPYSANRWDADDMNCECARKMQKLQRGLGGRRTFQNKASIICQSYGNFHPVQCVGSKCSCVNEFGEKYGSDVNIRSINSLPCVGDSCSSPQCSFKCPLGFEKDENGCEVCQCKEKPIPVDINTLLGEVKCSPVMCLMACQFGFRKNQHGCTICRCNPPPNALYPATFDDGCPPVTCLSNCPNGYVKLDGCRTCECNLPEPFISSNENENDVEDGEAEPKPEAECSKNMCRMYCADGFEKDDNGCDICRCKDLVKKRPRVSAAEPPYVNPRSVQSNDSGFLERLFKFLF